VRPALERAQAHGRECEVCGKELAERPAVEVPVGPLDGLDPTAHPPIDAGDERIAELEPTRHAPAAHVPDAMPGLDATLAAPVDVEVEQTPDVEPTAAGVPDDLPTAMPAIVACRYCRTPASSDERICTRCGMRLPIVRAAAADRAVDDGWRCSCGALAYRSMCATCGARRTTA
jgi:hypothetical protein